MNYFLSLIWFYLPGALANAAAVIGSKIPLVSRFNYPVDFGLKLNNQRIVGKHKVLGPAVFGIAMGFLTGIGQHTFFPGFLNHPLIIFPQSNQVILFYFLMSFGAIIGDLIKSFFKRQLNISPHKPWIPFDQIDHSLTSLLLLKIFFPIPWISIFTSVVMYGFLHVLSNVTAYFLKIKKVPY